MLFRSTCQGLIDGQPFTIVNRPADDGEMHETQWVARDLPVYVLGGFATGPLAWLVDGRLDVDVTTRWRPDDNDAELEMHCHLVAHGFAADVPEQLKVLQKVVEPTLAALNEANARLPIEFDVTMSKDAFRVNFRRWRRGWLMYSRRRPQSRSLVCFRMRRNESAIPWTGSDRGFKSCDGHGRSDGPRGRRRRKQKWMSWRLGRTGRGIEALSHGAADGPARGSSQALIQGKIELFSRICG